MVGLPALRIALCAVCFLCAAACGYVGDPLPPALHIPKRVEDLRAVEYGNRLIVQFTVPPETTEGLPLKNLGPIELRIGPGGQPFDMANWAGSAAEVHVQAQGPGPVNDEVAASPWIGKEVVIGVRLSNDRGRKSEWSNLVSLRVLPPLAPPTEVRAEATAGGVRLTWKGTEPSYRVFRKGPGEAKPAVLADSAKPEYTDATAEFDKTYEYRVQGIQDKSESEVSVPVAIAPKDTFPPSTPAGLTAISGVGSIELTWDRSPESDLRGYRVYRALDTGEFQRLAEFVDVTAYSDRQIESGKRYRYAVSATDQLGNESSKSAPVEAIAP